MRFCKLLSAAALGTVLGVAAAQAADLAVRPSPSFAQPLSPVPYNWSGFYAGINGGYAFGRSAWRDPSAGGSERFDTGGAIAGGQLGYNWQLGNVVLGIETDADWTNLSGSSTAGTVCAIDGGGQCQTQQNWFGTTRGRIGYAFGRFLPYATGGVAYGDRQVPLPSGTSTSVSAGWAAGAGLEMGITKNWSAKIEYLHLDLVTASLFSAASGASTLDVPVKDDLVRAGINYHW